MINRRRFTAMALAAAATEPGWAAPATLAALKVNEDGLYQQDWFVQSFLELADDLADADATGKRLAIFWELEGCPYCKETHLVNLADAEIRDYLKANFAILQLNLGGSRIVTDFDGNTHSEQKLARKWGIRFTPTVMFFPESAAAKPGLDGASLEVARMPGYFRPPHFLAMFRFVREKAYLTMDFRGYLRAARPG